jgi:hypothetical protein
VISQKLKTISKSEEETREYFKRKYNWDIAEADYQEVSQSMYYLGKAIYRSLQLEYKSDSVNIKNKKIIRQDSRKFV